MEWERLTESVGVYQADPYRFNEDSVRLAHFLRVRPHDRALDLGTGNGVLAVYGEALYGGAWTGIDCDPDAIALARASTERNGRRIDFRVLSAADAPKTLGHGAFDRIVTNPPYFTSGDEGSRAVQRHAPASLLSDWCAAAFLLLNNGGTLTLCYPADKLAVLFRALDQNRFAPKRMTLVQSGGTARLALVEAKKLGGDGMTVTVTQ